MHLLTDLAVGHAFTNELEDALLLIGEGIQATIMLLAVA